MRVRSIRIKNQASIFDSKELRFAPGLNLLVGQNNAGKTALLQCLSTRIVGSPHLSERTKPTKSDTPLQISQIDISIDISGAEMERLLLRHMNGTRFVPWPVGHIVADGPLSETAWSAYRHSASVNLTARIVSTPGSGPTWEVIPPAATRLSMAGVPIEPAFQNGTVYSLALEVQSLQQRIVTHNSVAATDPSNDAGLQLLQNCVNYFYLFKADRRVPSYGSAGNSEILAPDASNLPEVLNVLQGRPKALARYCSAVRDVVPSIRSISTRPWASDPTRQVEIVVWLTDPEADRNDLVIPLERCGTGVGQILAMLYVVLMLQEPTIVLVDEPGSFLHPGAARELIAIIRKHPQHQYFIAAHSPEIIGAMAQEYTTIAQWRNGESIYEQHESGTNAGAAAALAEIGAQLSDVFGYDKIIYVEGESDAAAARVLLSDLAINMKGIGLLPVRDPSSFRKKRTLGEILDLYSRLSHANALLPPALQFLFDRDGRSEQDLRDVNRRSGDRVRFTSRRMTENYFLDDQIVTEVFRQAAAEHGMSVQDGDVEKFRNAHGDDADLFPDSKPVPCDSPAWPIEVHGAKYLEKVFLGLSANTLTFNKVRDTPRLARAAVKGEMESARVLAGEIYPEGLK